MRVLFMSITSGQGHNSACQATISYLEEQGVTCHLLDTFRYVNQLLHNTFDRGYVNMTRLSPKFFGRIYRAAEVSSTSSNNDLVSRLVAGLLSRRLVAQVERFAPDVIVCSHVFSAMLATVMCEKGLLRGVTTYGIVTDFTLHPFWEKTHLNHLVLGSELMRYQAVKRGIGAETILPLGIPVNPKYSINIERGEARRMLGIPDITTLLVVAGSTSLRSVFDVVKTLAETPLDLQILVVCGNNKALKRRVDALELGGRVISFGFVNNIDVMMDAADIVLTKPGGLSTSEALSKRAPLLLLEPIPGLEEYNEEFLVNTGMACRRSDKIPVDELVQQLLNQPERMELMRRNQELMGKRDAAKLLGEHIIKRIREKE